MKTKLILTLLYLCSLSLFAEVNFNNEKILWQLPEKKIIPSSLKPSTTVFDIKDVVIPRISDIIDKNKPDFVFIIGVGRVYPFLRSHGILNNIEELANDCNMILFFPGEYNNLQLSLFGIISDENYYRGHNLNEIKIS